MLELLVVLGILALLATLTIVNVGGIFDDAKKDTAEIFVTQTLKTSLFAYKTKNAGFPSTAEGLQVLVGPYIEGKVPPDPWGEPYQYKYPGVKNKGGYDLWSKGPDKTDGTPDDIGNWDKEAAPAPK